MAKLRHMKIMNKFMIKHEEYIKRTYQLAKSAQEMGNHPFGAFRFLNDTERTSV
jgi:tRNA(Arg) A34 adenosine deaminase TadA